LPLAGIFGVFLGLFKFTVQIAYKKKTAKPFIKKVLRFSMYTPLSYFRNLHWNYYKSLMLLKIN